MNTALLLGIALAVPAWAGPAPEDSSRIFDGSGEAESLEKLKPEAPAPPAGQTIKVAKRTEVPPDLAAAKQTWGIDAQISLLAGRGAEPKTSFEFAVIGDAECCRFPWQRWWSPGKEAYRDQTRAMHAKGPDFICQLGDFVSKGNVKNYRAHVEFMEAEATIPTFYVIGNHDRSKPNGKADKDLYRAVFSEGDFYFDHNGWRFVGLDSADSRVTDAQLDWLDRILDCDLGKVIFTHVPPAYLKGKLQSPDHEVVGGKSLSGYFSEGSVRFDYLVSKHGVSRVYMGHIHAFATAEFRGVRYVLTAGGGSPLYPLPPGYPKRKKAHYLIVEAGEDGLEETVYEYDGTVFKIPWTTGRSTLP